MPDDLHTGQIARTVAFGQMNMLLNLTQAESAASEGHKSAKPRRDARTHVA